MRDSRADAVGSEVCRVVASRRRIARRVGSLARRIASDYAGGELTILAVLTGSVIFLSDLMRRLPLKMRLSLVSVSSYPGKSTMSRAPRFTLPEDCRLAGKDVLVVDDILDSGRTLKVLLDAVAARRPRTLRSCVLLRKERPDLPDRMRCDYVGFDIKQDFVVGYGLDYDDFYRNLPDVRVLNVGRSRKAPRKIPRRPSKTRVTS